MRRNNQAAKMEKRVSNIPIESVYTRHDIINRQDGYHFNHNAQWVSTFSNNKTIGLRRLELFPTTHNFEMSYSVFEGIVGTGATFSKWSAPIITRLVNKPPMWQVGSYETDKPIFTNSIQGETGNTFTWTSEENGRKCDINAFMYHLKYTFSEENHPDGSYKITMCYKKSTVKYTTKLFKVTNTYSIIDENDTYEIL